MNATLFVVIGLQLRAVVDGLGGYSMDTLAGYAAAVTGVVVAARVAWFFSVPYLVWAIDRPNRASDVGPAGRFIVAWSGMRGAVSLAVALAVPLTTDAGDPFPGRDLIVFLTFAAIFFTRRGLDASRDRRPVARSTSRKHRFAAGAGKIDDDGFEERTAAYQRTLQRLLGAQRGSLLRMRDDGDLSNEAMNRILRELDLEESRLEI